MSRRILVSQHVHRDLLEPLTAAGYDVDMRDDDRPAEGNELAQLLESSRAVGLICLLTDRIDRGVLAASPALRVVSTVAAGVDNIDVESATTLGIAVCNTPDALTEATADLTFALLLGAARRIPEGDAYLREGSYRRWMLDQPQVGLDVSGRALGILGMGKIAKAVARRATGGFGMTVRYTSRSRLSEADETALGVQWADWGELLRTSDFVSLHAPLTRSTRHLVDEAALQTMKRTAVLVNTARGPLVDEAALARALADGRIAGAGIDVYENEPEVHPDLLAQRDRVVLLPHLGSATAATRRNMVATAVRNMHAVLEGRDPDYRVNQEPA